ncbi:ABC transporter [Penicillium riverlandense]|uniref:ABC transporter n=1 Tax=Penicillium riverlandense TaxID=1903569 RepID=UPI002549B424|nr:ABC transporter [Penicillium riverlandense]KAJ5811290.1 ABC transporter [Penicillium riverlandense]
MLPRPSLRPWVRLAAHPFHRSVRLVSSAPPLIHIQDGTFYKQYPTANDASNPPLFPNLNFTLPSDLPSQKTDNGISPPHHWAVIGTPSRTDLLHVLRGQHICIPPTARSYPYLRTEEIAAKDPRLRFEGNAIQYIGFSGEGSGAIGGTRGAYLSARYESHREETDWTVQQFLRGQMSLNPLEGEEQGSMHDEQLLEQVITDLRLRDLLDMPVANLSNGQTRRARIAKALLKKPELLLLDEPFMGLDPATVQGISGLLHRLAEKCAPRLVLALRPQDTVPDWITHRMIVGNSQRILLQGSNREVAEGLEVWRKEFFPGLNKGRPQKESMSQASQDAMTAGYLDWELLGDLGVCKPKKKALDSHARKAGEPLIEMEGVRVQYGERAVLGDWKQRVHNADKDGLHWKARRGQRWAILGANGSGKTTLLSLITSDHPQTYALPIKLFGRSRLPEAGKPGISIFELQSRLGHSSPEIHAFFPRQLTLRQSLESAFGETFLSKPKLDYERDLDVNAVLRYFKDEFDPHAADKVQPPKLYPTEGREFFPKLGSLRYSTAFIDEEHDIEYADQLRFGELTTAQQRIVLFLRALIHRPDIVILDEPFSGLSASQRDKCLHFLDLGERKKAKDKNPEIRFKGLSDDQALVLISHVKEEIPNSVRHFMRLPSDMGVDEPLGFRLGHLSSGTVLSDQSVWDTVWSHQFDQHARRTERPPDMKDDPSYEDMDTYEMYTLELPATKKK